MTTEPFRNAHLSYSRLSRFEQCPLSYRLHYIEKRQAEPGLPLRFGKLVHAVLERLIKEVLDDERTGPLSEERALEVYREAWTAEGLTGVDVFEEGLKILRDFVREQGVVDHRDVLAIEKEFRLPVGPFTVLGFIDRVDWVDDETVEVIDYKTNRQLFMRDEVDTSLQLSLYHVAAQRLWPWAKKVKLTFWMLRHGIRQQTTRTEQQLADALAYVETLGRQTETAKEYPARLNANCSYCDHRKHCPAYADALVGKREFLCEDLADLEAVAREREEVARLAKALYARKEELEDILKAHLKEQDQLVLGGVRYRMYATTSLDYPIEPTLTLLGDATGLTRDELLEKLGAIDKKALDALLKSLGKKLDKPRVSLLKAELEAPRRRIPTSEGRPRATFLRVSPVGRPPTPRLHSPLSSPPRSFRSASSAFMGAPPPDENTWSTPTDRPYLVRMRPRFLRASGTMAGDRHAATTRLRDALDQAGAALTDVHFFSGVHTSFSFEIQEKALPTLHAALVAAGVRLRPEGDAAFAVGPRLAEEATVVGVLAISFADGDGDLTHEIPAVPG